MCKQSSQPSQSRLLSIRIIRWIRLIFIYFKFSIHISIVSWIILAIYVVKIWLWQPYCMSTLCGRLQKKVSTMCTSFFLQSEISRVFFKVLCTLSILWIISYQILFFCSFSLQRQFPREIPSYVKMKFHVEAAVVWLVRSIKKRQVEQMLYCQFFW